MIADWALVALGLIIFSGALTQRVTGMGFGLVASPFLVLLLGAGDGVPLVQLLSLVASLVVLISVFGDVEWRKAFTLLVPALIGLLPGWWLSTVLPPAALGVLVGVLIVLALLAVLMSERARVFKGTGGLISAGLLSGFMNVTAGVGGPAIVLYSVSTGWPHRKFVATVQVYFAFLNLGSLVAHGLPDLAGPTWLVVGAALGVGMVIGHWLSRHIDAALARRLVIAVAFGGATATIIRGLFDLVNN